jgi:predicted negative regulator of RcsB-dependent stress response
MPLIKHSLNFSKLSCWVIVIIAFIPSFSTAQDTSSSLLNINKFKLVKSAKIIVDSTRKKINDNIYNKVNDASKDLNNKVNTEIKSIHQKEEFDERPLPYERLLNTKYTLTRRAYQNTVSQFNYLFNAEEELKEIIQKARSTYKEEYGTLLSFYDYDLATTSKSSIDSIVYRCNANIVLHDLRSNWVDDAYLLLAKSYLFHRNFDTAASILQFINYSFDEKANSMDLPMGSNLRNESGRFSIANKDDNSIFKNSNVRNESLLWQARNYIESNQINEAISLLQLLKSDADFPKRLHPFLNEQFAYAYYSMESFERAANSLTDALPNAIDDNAKSRWYYLIAQLWQKANNTDKAYYWYKRASQFSPNPIIGVYATINLIRIESEKSNRNWQSLAKELEQITRKEKYNPYKDIIYFEMAKLAIQNKDFDKANEWLITAIKNNYNNPKQKQSAFELLGEINYNENKFAIAKIAYDSINDILKTNPQFENIMLRKKWLGTIVQELNNIENEDTLQLIYKLPLSQQADYATKWQKRKAVKSKSIKDLFSDHIKVPSNFLQSQQFATNNSNINNNVGSFYFENNNTISQGKQSFIQKWGERPNIDNWRRKTSGSMVNISANNSTNNVDPAKIISTIKEDKTDSSLIKLITNDIELNASNTNWNKAALITAQTFLLKLNDFTKAKAIYKNIIEKNIDSTITERALLDLASQYLHNGEKETSDNIIKKVIADYPNGTYIQKKKDADATKLKIENIDHLYKEALFFSQIGNWTELENLANNNFAAIYKSKWYLPLQFLKAKMYAQQKQDNRAINVLDSIIRFSKNELLKEKANNIIADIKNRKDTEDYLSTLQFEKIQLDSIIIKDASFTKTVDTNLKTITKDSTSSKSKEVTIQNNITKAAPKIKLVPIVNSKFIYDSAEIHYIALITNNTNGFIVSRIKDSLLKNYKIDFIGRKIASTISELQEKSYILWIGPFDNANAALSYLTNFAPSFQKGLNDYIAVDKFELITIGKSNIVQIKSLNDFKEYKMMMSNFINNH